MLRGIRVFLIVGLLCLLCLYMLPIPAYAAPVVSVWPSSGPPKIWIYLDGSGFHPNDGLTIYFDDYIFTASADSSGSFSIWIQVPEDLIAGTYTILVMDQHGNSASTYFDVTTPHLIVNPSSGPIGTKVMISGTGLGEYQYYVLKFDDIVLGAHIFYTLEDGRLRPEIEVTIPPAVKGFHNITLLYIPYYIDDVMTYEVMISVKFYVTDGIALQSDIHQLDDEINDLQDQINELKEDVSDLNQTIIDLQESLNLLNSTFIAFKEEVYGHITQIYSALSELSEWITNKFNEFENALAELDQKVDMIKEDLEELIMNVSDTLMAEINDVTITLQGQINSLKAAMEDIQSLLMDEINDVRAELEVSLETKISNISSEISTLASDTDSKFKDVNSKIETTNNTMKKNVEELKQSINTNFYLGIIALIIAIIAYIPGFKALRKPS